MKIKAEDFYEAIGAELEEYAGEVTAAVNKVIRKAARVCKDEIVERAPERTGDYKQSWRVTTLYKGPGGYRLSVNSKRYQLTHLLEDGHAKRNGGRVEGRPHIAPAARRMENELPENLEKAIGKLNGTG